LRSRSRPPAIYAFWVYVAYDGQWTGDANNASTINNSGTWTTMSAGFANSGTFNNNAGGTVSGLLTNTAGVTTNFGQLNGGATVSGGDADQ
jgi:hypothetical protein